MRAIIENMISPDYIFCYIPQALEILEKMKAFELASKEAAAPLMSVVAPLWFWKRKRKKD